MSPGVEGDCLGDVGTFRHAFQGSVGIACQWRVWKHFVFRAYAILFWQPFPCLNAQGHDDRAFGLLHRRYVILPEARCLLK